MRNKQFKQPKCLRVRIEKEDYLFLKDYSNLQKLLFGGGKFLRCSVSGIIREALELHLPTIKADYEKCKQEMAEKYNLATSSAATPPPNTNEKQ